MRHFQVLTAISISLFACASPTATTQAPRVREAMAANVSPEVMNAQILEDAKKTAAEQLGCPIEQVAMRCTDVDARGGCLAVQAKGCEKTLDYSFGSE